MKTNTFLKKTILSIALGFFTLALSAQVITIDNNPNSTTTYTTIQDALDNATSGDIIYVQPSNTTYGNATIFNPVTIVGRSHSEIGKTSILGNISIRTSNVELKGLWLNNITYSSVGAPIAPPFVGFRLYDCEVNSTFNLGTSSVQADAITISGNILRFGLFVDHTATDVEVSNNIILSTLTTENSAIQVNNNIFRGTSSITIQNTDPADGTLILFDNMFLINWGSNGNVNLNNGPFNLTNNLTHNWTFGSLNFLANASGSFTESGTLSNMDPLFTNVDNLVSQSFAGTSTYNSAFRPEDDLTLQAGSPALAAGTGGEQIGLFNSGFNFEKLGNPRGLPSLDITNYDGAVPKDGTINVTITSKAY